MGPNLPCFALLALVFLQLVLEFLEALVFLELVLEALVFLQLVLQLAMVLLLLPVPLLVSLARHRRGPSRSSRGA